MCRELPTAEMLIERVFSITNDQEFEYVALQAFLFQYHHNKLYQEFVRLMNHNIDAITSPERIPFLPISFFKTHKIVTTEFEPRLIFQSSGTTGLTTSHHYVKEAQLYETSFLKTFHRFYGRAEEYCILGLLPSYLERNNSSLVYMVNRLMERSNHPRNNFYLSDFEGLHQTLMTLEKEKQKTILFGVTYALLDFAAAYPMQLSYTTIIETGGMKGRKRELLRTEVHQQLITAFSVNAIHSEYGMTELLSQAYALEAGRFNTPPWMKILVREEDDPQKVVSKNKEPVSGVVNVIDLANVFSCCFIATDDAGTVYNNGTFEITGRIDNSDVRGCSLLAV